MDYPRKNTISLDMGEVKEKLSPQEVHSFVLEEFKFTPNQVECLEITGRKVCIKLATSALVERVMKEKRQPIVFRTKTGEAFTVKLDYENGTTKVRVLHLPPEMPNEEINKELQQYGRLVSVKNERWGKQFPYPVLNGVRVVEMQLYKAIPSSIVVAGIRALVVYAGQAKTCDMCSSKMENCAAHINSALHSIRKNLEKIVVDA